jgi:hypothetical protein
MIKVISSAIRAVGSDACTLAVEFHTGRTSALACLDNKLRFISRRMPEGEEHEQKQEPTRQAAAVPPSRRS